MVSQVPLHQPPSHKASSRQGLSRDLDREMEDVRRKGEEVQQLSTGLDGDWFLRTDKRLGTFSSPTPGFNGPVIWSLVINTKNGDSAECKADENRQFSNVKLFIQLKQKAGFGPQHYTIQFFTFVPDSMGYVAGLHKTDGSITHCAWRNVPQKLDTVLEREANNGVRHVAVGKSGSFVVILNNGIMFWSGVPESLSQKLSSAKREGLAAVVSLGAFLDARNSLTDLQIKPLRLCRSPSSLTVGISLNLQMGPRISASPQIGTLLSTSTPRKQCGLQNA
jgi:hypothetical protein